MQDIMVAQTIVTPQLTTAASMLICVAQPANASLHRALVKAEARLISQPWRIDAGVLTIVSHSKQNETHQTDGDYCECKTTRGVCWHRAAWLILSTLAAGGCHPVANLPLPSALDIDELPGSFLDGDFSAFDDDSLTHDQYGKLLPEFAPAHDEYGDIIPAPAPSFVEVDGPVVLVKRRPAPFRLQPATTHTNPLDASVDVLFAA